MTRRTITERDARAYAELVKIRFADWIEAGYSGDVIVKENWDGEGHWAIIWDGPYEWSYYASGNSFAFAEKEPEFGIALPIVPVPASLKHVFSEPYNSGVLVLYLDT